MLALFRLKAELSKIRLILEINAKDRLECELKRHLSPRTIGTILRALPLEGNMHLLGKNIVYLETPLSSGIERAKKDFKKGDIAFLPSGGSICFFLADSSPGKTMTPLGKITSNLDALSNVKSGNVLKFYADVG